MKKTLLAVTCAIVLTGSVFAMQPPAAVGLLITIGDAISRSTLPPLKGTRAGYTDMSSVTRTVIDFPSALKRGCDTPRSSAADAFTCTGPLLPSVGTIASRSMP